MPQPSQYDVHVNVPMTNISIAHAQDAENYISSKIAPVVKVKKRSDKYYVFPKGQWFRNMVKERGESEESAGTGYSVQSNESYYCKTYALHVDINDYTRENADDPLDMDADASELLTDQMLLSRDIQWASTQFKAGVWSVDADVTQVGTGNGKWSAANSTPIEDLRKQITAFKKRNGRPPNKLVAGAEVWSILQDHVEFLDRINGGATTGNPALFNQELLARMLGLEDVIVAEAIQNDAVEGAADNFNFICGKHALLLYVNPTPGLRKPSATYTFVWDTFAAGPDGQKISKYRQDLKRSDRLEIETNYDFKVTGTDLGTFFPDVVA